MNTSANHHRPLTLAAVTLACVIAGGASAAPHSDPMAAVGQPTIDELKLAYRNCNREALAGHLDRRAIMGCSMVYEALKHRAFDGDFARLLTWSRAQGVAADEGPRTTARRE